MKLDSTHFDLADFHIFCSLKFPVDIASPLRLGAFNVLVNVLIPGHEAPMDVREIDKSDNGKLDKIVH